MFRLLKPISIVFVFLLLGRANAQIDREFWFAVPEVTNKHADRPIYLHIASQSRPCNVTIDIPANALALPVVINLVANDYARVDITNWITLLENDVPEAVLNRGLRVSSTDLITVYYETAGVSAFSGNIVNTDIFSLKGSNALGTAFFIPFQSTLRNQTTFSLNAWSSFDIVATEDNTSVTIIPTNNTVSHAQNVPFTILLNKGQTYSVRANGVDASDRMPGSSVKSDKPICVTLKDDSVLPLSGGAYDLIGDQLTPVEKTGTEYIIQGGLVTVLAVKDSTVVNFNGAFEVLLDSAQSYDAFLTGANTRLYIESSAPVYVFQIKDFAGEMGGALIPHIQCTGSYDVVFSRATEELFKLSILIKDGNQGAFELDGNPSLITAAWFTPVTANPDWVMAEITFTTSQIGIGAHRITNSQSPFQLGTENGTSNTGFRYGYFSNFNLLELGIDVDACDGSVLDAGFGKDTYLWSTGETTSTIDVDSSGTYWAVVTEDGCVAEDTINVSIRSGVTINLGPDTVLCEQDSILLGPVIDGDHLGLTYFWNGSVGDSTYSASAGQTVYLKVYNAYDCVAYDSVVLGETAFPVALLPTDTVLCARDFSLQLDRPYVYVWEGPDATLSGNGDVIGAKTSGWYVLSSSNTCGAISDSVWLEFREVEIPNIITPNGDGQNEVLLLHGVSYGEWDFQLFNRWGKRVIRTNNVEEIRVETHIPDGLYFYSLTDDSCNTSYNGWLKIVR